MAELWHYAEGGMPKGPVGRSAIEAMIREGAITRTTLIWREGLAEWVAAWTEFPFDIIAPPPLPGRREPERLTSHGTIRSGHLYAGAPARRFGEAISVCLDKYATFSGRASRSEYWYFSLFSFLVSFGLNVLELVVMERDSAIMSNLFWLATLLPTVAVTVRRLHDTGRSGWWVGGGIIGLLGLGFFASTAGPHGNEALGVLLGLAFLIWCVAMFVFLVLRGDPGPNAFG
ncbi:DUF805 domain-containing protein [Albidovulum sp.]|uniref:DUF805 domain-containing protein n=1 Tax=Albidovulum sp. TaxID=1872424 RepID=UPI0039B98092